MTTTLFQIASITKEFTSVGVMLLVEAGKVKLEDPIAGFRALGVGQERLRSNVALCSGYGRWFD